MLLGVDTDTQLEILEELFDQSLVCQIGYSECVQDAAWIADGICPQCGDHAPGRLICDPCHSNIQSGRRMRHDNCGYRGLGIEFFPAARKL